MIKGKGQRLIPEELLKYLQAYKENHPDPTGGGGATLEDIVDSAGNKRFIEGDGETSITAFTNLYKKWSLSGSHLMCVFAGKNESGSSYQIDSGTTVCDFSVPDWILNKIYPISGNVIELKNMSIYLSGNFNANFATKFIKNTGKISIIANENKQFVNHAEFRIQFDLLIDADYS